MDSLLEKNTKIEDIYNLHHRHDKHEVKTFNYTENLIKQNVSSVLYMNRNNKQVLDGLNKLLVTIVDSSLPIRNMFFNTVDKYYNKHGK